MRNKKARKLKKAALLDMPRNILMAVVDYGDGIYQATNPYKNFIRNQRKASRPTTPVSKKGYTKMMKSFNREQRKLRKLRKSA